jgi:hypothetical protein
MSIASMLYPHRPATWLGSKVDDQATHCTAREALISEARPAVPRAGVQHTYNLVSGASAPAAPCSRGQQGPWRNARQPGGGGGGEAAGGQRTGAQPLPAPSPALHPRPRPPPHPSPSPSPTRPHPR